MLTVRTNGGKAGDTVYFRNGSQSVSAVCLTDVNPGEAIALLTDKGNWYLTGDAVSASSISNERIIEYRQSLLSRKTTNLAFGIIVTVTYPTGINPDTNPFLYPITSSNKLYVCEVDNNGVFTIKKQLAPVNYRILMINSIYIPVDTGGVIVEFDESILATDYSCLGYASDGTLKYLTVSIAGGSTGSRDDFSKAQCLITSIRYSNNIGAITINTLTISLGNTANQLLAYPSEIISTCIKYKDKNNIIKYIGITGIKDIGGNSAGSSLYKAIVIWDLGDINNLLSKLNPCCSLGQTWNFKYKGRTDTGLILSGGFSVLNPGDISNPEAGQKPITAYGCIGGIVLKVDIPGTYYADGTSAGYPYRKQVFVFVKEDFLVGEKNITLTPDDVIFSSILNASIADQEYKPVNVGEMPLPLENKDVFLPYTKLRRIGKFSNTKNTDGMTVSRLYLPTIFDKDKRKQIFSN